MVYQENYLREIFLKENGKNVTNDFKNIFNFESKFELKCDCPKKNFDLPNIFIEGEKEEMLKTCNIDLNGEIIQSLISQANDTRLSLKYKEKELQNYYNKFENHEGKIHHYLKEMQNLSKIIDEIIENFNTHIIINEQNLERKRKECESLKKYITNNLNGNNIFNCPLCKERAISGKEYLSQIYPKEKAKEKFFDSISEGNIGLFCQFDEKNSFYILNIGNFQENSIIEFESMFYSLVNSFPEYYSISHTKFILVLTNVIIIQMIINVNVRIVLKQDKKELKLI